MLSQLLRSRKWTKILAFPLIPQNQRLQLGYETETNFPVVVSRSRLCGTFALQIRNFSSPQKGPRSTSLQVKFIEPQIGHTCRWPFTRSPLPRVTQRPVCSRRLPSHQTGKSLRLPFCTGNIDNFKPVRALKFFFKVAGTQGKGVECKRRADLKTNFLFNSQGTNKASPPLATLRELLYRRVISNFFFILLHISAFKSIQKP